MKLRGVLFDLDGTLIDHERAVADALRSWLPTLGIAASPAEAALWDELQERHLAAWRDRSVTFAEQRRRRLRDFLTAKEVPFRDADLDTIFKGYLRAYEDAWRPFDDVEDALTALAGLGLATAVLTNGTAEQQHAKLRRTGLAGRVGPVWTVDDLGAAKPDPAVFRDVCARWGLPPSAVLSVGDRHDLDILPARAAGLPAVRIDRRTPGPDDLRSLRDLTGWITRAADPA